MAAHASCLFALALGVALGCASSETRQSIQGSTNDAASVSRVLDDLIERSRHIESFVADYRVSTDESSGTGRLRIALDAQGQMGLEMTGDQASMSFREVNGMLIWREIAKDGTRKRAELPLKELIDRDSTVIDRLNADFPSDASKTSLARQNRWAITCSYDKDGPPGKRFNLRIGYGPADSMFGWLDWLKSSEFACTDRGDVLTFELSDSTRLDLSKESGFVTSIRVSNAESETTKLTLEHIDLAPPPEASALDIPTSSEGFVDESNRARESTTLALVDSELDTICTRVSDLSAKQPNLLVGENRATLARLFELVHRDRMGFAYASWVQKNYEWIDDRQRWLEDAYDTVDDDHDSIASLDAEVTSGRERLQENLATTSEEYCSRLAIKSSRIPSDELRRDLQETLD